MSYNELSKQQLCTEKKDRNNYKLGRSQYNLFFSVYLREK